MPSQVGARAQLRISGLFPSAYWCGQALVDIPLCWLLLFSMFGLQFAMSNNVSGSIDCLFLLVHPILVIARSLGKDQGNILRTCRGNLYAVGADGTGTSLGPQMLIDLLLVSPPAIWVSPAGNKRQ